MKLQQLLALEAIVKGGSFQEGARLLHKTHPSVITGIKRFEDELGFQLFNRDYYRATLTTEGEVFYRSCTRLLDEAKKLKVIANNIAVKEETELNIVIGDVVSVDKALSLLKGFFDSHPNTQLNLLFENISGPNERLLNGGADLIIHHIQKTDRRYEYQEYSQVELLPVVAPGFLDDRLTKPLTYDDLTNYTQCIIRDTAKTTDFATDYHLLNKTRQIMVGDQHTKKSVIKLGLGWGHMPLFMIREELENGELLTINGGNIRKYYLDIVAARRSDQSAGVIAERLWQYLGKNIQ